MPSRAEILLASVPRRGRIIEIGPSFSPIAAKADGWDTRTLDHLTREGLVAKYTGHPGVNVDRIEDVDYVWTGGLLSDAVPPAMHGTFDAFVASHVIEHTPDLIAFLGSAATLLKPDGIVVLAIPDKRYCFDYFQPLTTTGQLIDAHVEQQSRHSRRLIFDHFAYAVAHGDTVAWGQHPCGSLRFLHPFKQAHELASASGPASDYVDVHAWRFSPASFQLLLLELARIGETDWRVEHATEINGMRVLRLAASRRTSSRGGIVGRSFQRTAPHAAQAHLGGNPRADRLAAGRRTGDRDGSASLACEPRPSPGAVSVIGHSGSADADGG